MNNHINILQDEVKNLTEITQRQQFRLNQIDMDKSQKRGRKASKSGNRTRRKSQISTIEDRSRSGFTRKCCVAKHAAIEHENKE